MALISPRSSSRWRFSSAISASGSSMPAQALTQETMRSALAFTMSHGLPLPCTEQIMSSPLSALAFMYPPAVCWLPDGKWWNQGSGVCLLILNHHSGQCQAWHLRGQWRILWWCGKCREKARGFHIHHHSIIRGNTYHHPLETLRNTHLQR